MRLYFWPKIQCSSENSWCLCHCLPAANNWLLNGFSWVCRHFVFTFQTTERRRKKNMEMQIRFCRNGCDLWQRKRNFIVDCCYLFVHENGLLVLWILFIHIFGYLKTTFDWALWNILIRTESRDTEIYRKNEQRTVWILVFNLLSGCWSIGAVQQSVTRWAEQIWLNEGGIQLHNFEEYIIKLRHDAW